MTPPRNPSPFDVRKGTVDGRSATATFSPGGLYRYHLSRALGYGQRKSIVFIMLNPSTASHERDDPTLRRCIGFAIREGATTLEVVNLFALVATNPRRLMQHPAPVGAGNDAIVELTCMTGSPIVIAAWGVPATKAIERRAEQVVAGLAAWGIPLHCLGDLTQDGHPRHPLYLPAKAPLRQVRLTLGPTA